MQITQIALRIRYNCLCLAYNKTETKIVCDLFLKK